MEYRIGHSHDIHRLVPNRKLILGGIEISHERGLLGHSDADVVLHVVAESILGALGLGDLGTHFPDTSEEFLNITSSKIVEKVVVMMQQRKYYINNMDITVFLERPILKPYIAQMRQSISKLLFCNIEQINIKATRGEGLGPIGLEEGISAESVVLLKQLPQIKPL